MDKIDYGAVQTLLALDNRVIRTGLRQAFTQAGFNGFSFGEASSQGAFLGALEGAVYDLIIISAELDGFFVAPMINAMRDGRLPHHPFPIVIMLLAEGNSDYVRKADTAGADHMMLLPVAPGPMLKRIDEFAVYRRPFVVTMDYVGPDRRKSSRPGTEQIQLVDVPNPLAASIKQLPLGERQSQIDLTKIQLNTLKLERYVVQFRWLDNTIRTMFGQNKADATNLETFAKVMKRIAARLPIYYSSLFGDIDVPMAGILANVVSGADAILRYGLAIDQLLLDGILANCRALADEIQRLMAPSF